MIGFSFNLIDILREFNLIKTNDKYWKSLSIVPQYLVDPGWEKDFCGRDEHLQTISREAGKSSVKVLQIVGIGGSGKTSLVQKWYQLEKDIISKHLFSFKFESNTTSGHFFSCILRFFGEQPENILKFDNSKDRLARCCEAFYHNRKKKLYLILDNIEKSNLRGTSKEEFAEILSLLRHVLESPFQGLVIISSRISIKELEDHPECKTIDVSKLCEEDALEFLAREAGGIPKEQAKQVVESLDYHAFSICLFGNKYRSLRGPEQKNKYILKLLEEKLPLDNALEGIIANYFSGLPQQYRIVSEVIAFLRNGSPEKFAVDFIFQELGTLSNFETIEEVEEVMAELYRSRFIDIDSKGRLNLHALVRAYLVRKISPQTKKEYHRKLYKWQKKRLPNIQTCDNDGWQDYCEIIKNGCEGKEFKKTYQEIYLPIVQSGSSSFITMQNGRWNTNLEMLRYFFPAKDLFRIPVLNGRKEQNFLMNEAGLAFLNIGEILKGIKIFEKKAKRTEENEDWLNSSTDNYHLAGLYYRKGNLHEGEKTAKKALEHSIFSENKENEVHIHARYAYILFLLGRSEASIEFEKVNKKELMLADRTESILRGIPTIKYADYLYHCKRYEEAMNFAQKQLKRCQNQNWIGEKSRCNRFLGVFARDVEKKNQEALSLLKKACSQASFAGTPEIILQSNLEMALWYLNNGDVGRAENHKSLAYLQLGQLRLYSPSLRRLDAAIMTLNKDSRAKDELRKALDEAKGMGFVPEVEKIEEKLAQL